MPRKPATVYFPNWIKLEPANLERAKEIIEEIIGAQRINVFAQKAGINKSTIYRIKNQEINSFSQEMIYSILACVENKKEREIYQKELLKACGYVDFGVHSELGKSAKRKRQDFVQRDKKAISYYLLSNHHSAEFVDEKFRIDVHEQLGNYESDFVIKTDIYKDKGIDKLAVFSGPFYKGIERTLFDITGLTMFDKFGARGFGLMLVEENRRKFNNVKELYKDINISEYIAVAHISKDGDVKEVFNIPTESAVEKIL